MNKKVISIVLAATFVAGTSYQAFATPISDGQKQEIEETRSEYTELNSKILKLESELMKLTADMNPVFLAKEENDKKIASIKQQREEVEKEIPKLQMQIKEKEALLGQRISGVYKSGGQMNMLSMLLTSESFGDFLGNINAVSTIMRLDNEMIETIKEDKKVLDDKIKILENQKIEVEKLNKDNEEKIKEFKVLEKEQEKVMNQLEDERKNVKINLDALEGPLAKPLIDIINNSSSTKEQIQTAINSLTGLRNQIVSPNVDKQIVQAIEKGKDRINQMTAPIAPPPTAEGGNGSSSENTGNGETVAPPASGSTVDRIIAEAYKHIGKPYIMGATGPNAFDCSGFTQYIYRQAGVGISRTTFTQVKQGRHVPYNQLQRGDLVFTEGSVSSPTHVGVYIGNGQMIHASNPRDGVKVSSVYRYVTARRIL
ncbi:MAG: NlpC/P60 family protein [Sarcina sp.]